MNIPRIALTLANFLTFLALFMLLPSFVSALYDEWTDARLFLWFGVIIAAIGMVGRFVFRRADRTLYRREGLLIVVGCWLLAALVGAVPFMLSGVTASFEDAFFESMSGFTTTGSSILTELGSYGKGIMFWRSLTHWLGGMGIVVLFVAILPALGVSGRLLYEFEVPGVENDDLKPRIRETALLLWKIYVAFSILEFGLLMLAGLDAYDAIVHTFGTVSTGGFSPHGKSVAHFNSPLVESIIIVFMFLAGVNFTLFWRAKSRGIRAIFKDLEFRWYGGMLLGITILIALTLAFSPAGPSAPRAILDAAFVTVSVGTSTGFGTADFDRWPDGLRMLLVMLMFVGGCAGSTAGGFKVIRIVILMRLIQHELRRFVRPRRVATLVIGGQKLSEDVVRSVYTLFVISVITIFGSALVLTALGHDLLTSVTGVMATLFCIGPGLGPLIGPTGSFADIHPLGKVLLSLLMLFGRLEVFTLLALLQPSFYKD